MKVVFVGDAYISSMAIKDLYECFGKENVDEKTYEVATNLLYRDFITVGLLVSIAIISCAIKLMRTFPNSYFRAKNAKQCAKYELPRNRIKRKMILEGKVFHPYL